MFEILRIISFVLVGILFILLIKRLTSPSEKGMVKLEENHVTIQHDLPSTFKLKNELEMKYTVDNISKGITERTFTDHPIKSGWRNINFNIKDFIEDKSYTVTQTNFHFSSMTRAWEVRENGLKVADIDTINAGRGKLNFIMDWGDTEYLIEVGLRSVLIIKQKDFFEHKTIGYSSRRFLKSQASLKINQSAYQEKNLVALIILSSIARAATNRG
ncbi:hypothetical protein ACE1TH_13655 [Shouchella sp. JSM 1781072]|uniref:hypothetical protein n=1 Tax=Shouchella sp. JSM 1781072 TaxID=3344581 RepID=UPI0035C01CF4